MSIFYGLVQMIRGLFMLGFNSVCFYNTRNRPLLYVFTELKHDWHSCFNS